MTKQIEVVDSDEAETEQQADVRSLLSVCTFAAPAGKYSSAYWEAVHFNGVSAYAQTDHGGMLRLLADVNLRCSINAGLLSKALRTMPVDERVTFKQDKTTVRIKAGSVTVDLPCLTIENAPTFHMPAKSLKWIATDGLSAVDRVAATCCDELSRPHLQGIYFDEHGASSTNGHACTHVSGTDFEVLFKKPVLVPPGLLKGLGSGTHWVAADAGRIYISELKNGEQFRSVKMIEHMFPDLKSVLMADGSECFADQATLLAVLKRIKTGSKIANFKVQAKRLHITTDGASMDSLFAIQDTCPLTDVGVDMTADTITFNVDLVVGAVARAGEGKLRLLFGNAFTPMHVYTTNYHAVVAARRP